MTEDTQLSIPYGPGRRPWHETLSEVGISPVDGAPLVTPPSFDPLEKDRSFPDGVTPALYQVPSCGLSAEEQENAMEQTQGKLEEGAENMFGFMVSQDWHCPRHMQSSMVGVSANIAGDPFTVAKAYNHMPKWVERNVLDYFASLWNAKWPHNPDDPESYWGYVLTMGSSEGNLHALWSARNYLTLESSNMDNPAAQPVLFFSQNANFSICKLADIVGLMQFHQVGEELYPDQNPLGGDWVQGVPCTGGDAGPGTIDIDALEKLVDFFSAKGHPIVVLFSYGTTLKGSCDDVKSGGERLVNVLKNNNMYERTIYNSADPSKSVLRKRFWFHVDGALSAAYMPFLEMAYKNGLTDVAPASEFDFRLDFVSSIVTSGHKYIGTPWPCGVYLTRNSLLCSKEKCISYTGATDTTLSLSRNAHSPMLLWSYISSNPYDTQVANITRCLDLVPYTLHQLKELEKRIGLDLMVMNTPPSLSILFRKPTTRIVLKYALTVATLVIESEEHAFAQIYIMRHITTNKSDSFLSDLESPNAFVE